MWEGRRTGPAARRVCHGLGAGGGLDWRRGLEGRSRGTCSRGQLKFPKDDLVLENSARSCRRVADPGALAVWGGEWVPPNRVVATAAQTQDSHNPHTHDTFFVFYSVKSKGHEDVNFGQHS